MQDRIIGTTMPVLEITLDPGEAIFSESGELSWMTSSVVMQTSTQMGGGGGVGGEGVADPGAPGGNGFIRIALKDPVPQAQSTQSETASPAPSYVAPAATSAPAAPAEMVEPVRPARRDRN